MNFGQNYQARSNYQEGPELTIHKALHFIKEGVEAFDKTRESTLK